MKENISNNSFFNSISGLYDEMINFPIALERRTQLLKKFIKPGMHEAADLGCGTGLDSISLTLNGLKLTAFDQSEDMLKKAKENAGKYGLNIDFHKTELDKISNKFKGRFDIAFSLGNTLVNLDRNSLKSASRKISNILKPEGILVVQILNFEMIKNNNKRIIKISRTGEYFTIRFYDILKEYFNFNILKFNSGKPVQNELFTTRLYPYDQKFMKAALMKSGFHKIKLFGDLKLNKFSSKRSNDLVITCIK